MKNYKITETANVVFIMLAIISIVMIFAPTAIFGQTGERPDPRSLGFTPGRIGALTGNAIGLIGSIVGGLALLRPSGMFGTANGRLGAVVALAAGLTAFVLGGIVAATSGGHIGTGGGLAGAIIALVLGLIAAALGALALSRARPEQGT